LPDLAAQAEFTPATPARPVPGPAAHALPAAVMQVAYQTAAQEPIAVPVVEAALPVASAAPAGAVTQFFGVPAQGRSIVYVIDRSASMGLENRLGRAVGEVKESLALLPAHCRFQLVAYARLPEMLRQSNGLVAAGPESVALAGQQLNQLRAEGGTDHVRALKTALLLSPDVIYFLTDEDELTLADVNTITAYNRGRTSIHTICLVAPASKRSPMQELARRNRGQFRVAASD
jgi:hypothetical protein